MARRKTKAYPESFRKEAVRLADLPDRTATEVAKELGIHVGQSVEALVSSLEARSDLLNSILTDKGLPLHIREVAGTIEAMNRPDAATEQLKELEQEGSWYSGELIRYIAEWGEFDPYA